jgi:hypothetical protein
MSRNFRRHVTNAANVRFAIFLAEAESFGKVRADNVAVKHCYLSPMLQQHDCQDVGCG